MGKKRKILISLIASVSFLTVLLISIIAEQRKERSIIIKANDEIAQKYKSVKEEPTVAKEPVMLVISSNTRKAETKAIKNTMTADDSEKESDETETDMIFSEEEILTVTSDELVEWAKRAYNENWEYVYGGCEEGHVDCSGLIKSKVEVCARGTEELLAESAMSGDISTLPDIPGLGVYSPGHVGIYVGEGKVIDARTEDAGIGYDVVEYEAWTAWFEIKGVDYSRYTNGGYE